MKDRYYQRDCVDSVQIALGEYDRTLMVLGTGSGKTYIAGRLIKTLAPARCLFLADADELCTQPLASISRVADVIPALEKSDSYASLEARVVVGSSQSLCKQKRLERFPRDHFDYIFIDEVHRGLDRDIKIAEYFNTAKVVGITATPFTSKVQDLSQWFPFVAYRKQMIDLIGEGFAPPWQIVTLPVEIDLAGTKVRQKFGEKEYDAEETAHKIEPWFHQIAETGKKHIKGRHGIAFLPLKASSEKFAQICREHGIIAVHVAGDSVNREEIMESFRMGRIELLCNAGVASTGVDLPIADLFLNLRLTKSLAWYQQAAGRGGRVLPGVIDHLTEENQAEERRALIAMSAKKNCLVLDLLWQNDMLGLVHAGHLISQDEGDAKAILKFTRKLRTPQDLIELARKVQADREERLRKALEEAAQKSKDRLLDPLLLGTLLNDKILTEYHPIQSYELSPPTPSMLTAIEKFGINPDGVKTHGFGKKILDLMVFRAKYGMANIKAVLLIKRMLKDKIKEPERLLNGRAWMLLKREFARRKAIGGKNAKAV